MSGMTKQRRQLFGAATLTICSTLTLAMTTEAPLILYPITPSLPPGLYIRTFAPPKPGMIAAFHIPETAKRYKASIGEHVREDFLFMKPIVAGPGDHVCGNISIGLHVNAVSLAEGGSQASENPLLPNWRACRRLADNEFFVASVKVPSSFDSRHFGPISEAQLLGQYVQWRVPIGIEVLWLRFGDSHFGGYS